MIIQTKGDVIKISGALTENQWTAIKSAVNLLLEEHPRGVVIDASGITEVTESGARTFLDAGNYIQTQNARIVVASLHDSILAEIKKIPGVRSQLVVAGSVEEGLASLESGSENGKKEVISKPFVLVPLMGMYNRALEFAAAEAAARRAELHLLYVLQIPRNQPLGASIPALEQEAQLTLDQAEKALKRSGVKVRKYTTRARDLIEGAAKYAADTKPLLLLVAYSKEEMTREGMRCPLVSALCHEAPCDVAIYCINT